MFCPCCCVSWGLIWYSVFVLGVRLCVSFSQRQFNAYFPRSFAQVQPCLPDISELLRFVRTSASASRSLSTSSYKRWRGSFRVLEGIFYSKNAEIAKSMTQIEELGVSNKRMGRVREMSRARLEEEKTMTPEQRGRERRESKPHWVGNGFILESFRSIYF